MQGLRRRGIEDVALRKWSIPIVAALGRESRSGELRRAIGATPRAYACAEGSSRPECSPSHAGFSSSTRHRLTPTSKALRRRVTRLAAAL